MCLSTNNVLKTLRWMNSKRKWPPTLNRRHNTILTLSRHPLWLTKSLICHYELGFSNGVCHSREVDGWRSSEKMFNNSFSAHCHILVGVIESIMSAPDKVFAVSLSVLQRMSAYEFRTKMPVWLQNSPEFVICNDKSSRLYRILQTYLILFIRVPWTRIDGPSNFLPNRIQPELFPCSWARSNSIIIERVSRTASISFFKCSMDHLSFTPCHLFPI